MYFRYIRGLLGLALILGVILFFGSLYMRAQVLELFKSRVIAANSTLLSRAFRLDKETKVAGAKLRKRLRRLGYRYSDRIPTRSGEYHIQNGDYYVFLRGADIAPDATQRELLVHVELDDAGKIREIWDVKFRKPLGRVWLEPEIISLLGDSPSRASSRKHFEEFPDILVQSVLSIEDERFYVHFGIDPFAVVRAIFVNLRSGSVRQGASTITQQLAKNLFLTPERSLKRKVKEAIAAVLLETAFSKEQILEFYLNEIFLGQEGRVAIHGFGEAARSFFGKDVMDLNPAEAATLAGIIKAPSKYSPRRFPQRALSRRQIVLNKLEERGTISEEEKKRYWEVPLAVIPAQRTKKTAPYFTDFVRRILADAFGKLDFDATSLTIRTGIDVEYQRCAQNALQQGLENLEKARPKLKNGPSPLQAALIAVLPSSGEVIAWVGGRNYSANQFDRVSQAKRQPGSAFKPFVYLTALDGSLNSYRVARTTNLLADRPIEIAVPGSDNWSPRNYDKKYRGEVTLREGLALSLNIPTVDLAMKVGIESVAQTAELFGFGKDLPRVPSLALGAGEVSPLELARAYSAISNGGRLGDLIPITAIEENDSQEVIYRAALAERRVASEDAVFVLTNIMQSVIESGTARGVRRRGFKLPAAGKTGTSNDTRDAWFAGFTPGLLAVVWVGFDDNREIGLTGGGAAAPIWTEFMKCVSPMQAELDFIPPPGVVYRRIDNRTGLLYRPECSGATPVTEIFVRGTQPTASCTSAYRDKQRYPYELGRVPNSAGRRGARGRGSRSGRGGKRTERSFWDQLFGR